MPLGLVCPAALGIGYTQCMGVPSLAECILKLLLVCWHVVILPRLDMSESIVCSCQMAATAGSQASRRNTSPGITSGDFVSLLLLVLEITKQVLDTQN